MTDNTRDTSVQWLTVREVADRLRVDTSLVTRWLRAGKLRGHVLTACNYDRRRQWRIAREDFEAFVGRELVPFSAGHAASD